MAESQETRVGKFTVIKEEATSPTSPFGVTEATGKEDGEKSTQDSVEPFTIKSTQKSRRGRPAGTTGTKQTPVVQAVAEAPANYHLWSQLLIGSANTVVVTWLGMECAMEKREADMLEPPIARILQRLTPEQSQKVSVFIDPMVMLIALGMWGNRIIRIQRGKRQTISQEELARASGVVAPPSEEVDTVSAYPERPKVPVNPNGVPTAITDQMREV